MVKTQFKKKRNRLKNLMMEYLKAIYLTTKEMVMEL